MHRYQFVEKLLKKRVLTLETVVIISQFTAQCRGCSVVIRLLLTLYFTLLLT